MPTRRTRRLRKGYTRRQFLATGAKIGAAGAVAGGLTLPVLAPKRTRAAHILTPQQRTALDAAVARLIPAEGPSDWSAADAGAGDYIEKLLEGTTAIYAGGPTRPSFGDFQQLSRIKEIGWQAEAERLRALYAEGLAELDRRAGGNFAAAPEAVRDTVLETLDLEGSPFFAALFDHTMEGVYAHPVYGGNKNYVSWKTFCYQGDVHGVRFPSSGSQGAWNEFGGYAPEEMAEPGNCPGQGPEES